jgi:phage gp29-like protein
MDLISLNIGELAPVSKPEVVSAPATHQPVDIAELGATGTPIFGGFLRELGEYNPELTGLSAYRVYEQMRRSDAQVKATLMACKLPIRSAEWTVMEPAEASPVEKEATELVRSCLFEELDFDGIIENALLMLDFGAAVHEDVWYIDGKQIRLKKCAARLPLTFYRWLCAPNGDDLVALEQMGYRGGAYLVTQIPVGKLSLFTFGQEGANFTGISLLRSMYQHWYIKSNLYKVEAIACERNGMGVPNITMGGSNIKSEDRVAAMSWLRSLAVNESTSILNPPDWKFELTGVNGQVVSCKEAIEHHNQMITQAGLASFINMGQGHSSGNRSLGQTMSDFFYLGLQATANSIARTISLTTVKRLCDLNFTGIQKYPRVAPQQILSAKIESVVDTLQKLASGACDVIQPDEELESWIREKLGAPKAGKPRVRPGGGGAAPSGGGSAAAGTFSETADPYIDVKAAVDACHQIAMDAAAQAAQTFKPKRAPRGAEKYLALNEINSALNKGRDDIAAALRAARPRVQAEIVQKLMNKPVRDAHRVSVDLDAKLVSEIEGILEGVYAYGLQTITDEKKRQLAGKAPETAAKIRAAEKRDPLGVYSDGVVSEFTNNLQQRATNVIIDAKRRPGDRTPGQMILDASQQLDDQSDGWMDNVAAKGANEAFADGRADGYAEHADEISEVIYSALLDPNTCENCSAADGASDATPDDIPDVPNPDCDGGDKCRCVHVFVFADEAKSEK